MYHSPSAFTACKPLLPRPSNVVKSYLCGLVRLIDNPIDWSPDGRALFDAGCVYMPYARLAIAGTSCAAPLLQAEASQISQLFACDMLLLRCEAGQGLSLDVRLTYKDEWLTGYLPWMGDRELWLLPSNPELPSLKVDAGLFEQPCAPYADEQPRCDGFDEAYRALCDLARWSI